MTEPTFNCTVAREFLQAVHGDRPAALVVGFTEGVSVAPGHFSDTLQRAADENQHLFFHVATLKPEWADPASHAKGKVTTASKDHVLECPYLWGDCDAEKYVGADDPKKAQH